MAKTTILTDKIRCIHPSCRKAGIPRTMKTCPACGHVLHIADLLPSDTVLDERYAIDHPLGRGWLRAIYRGVDQRLHRPVIIEEFFPRALAVRDVRDGGLMTTSRMVEGFETKRERFVEESLNLGRVRHPGIVALTDLFEAGRTTYRVLDHVPGQSLRAQLDGEGRVRWSPHRAQAFVEQLVEALEVAHAEGLYHLDLRPENIIMAPWGQAVLIDFGAARVGMATETGANLMATAAYAAPEVASNSDCGPRSDLYSLVMIFHELLSGERPPSARRRRSDAWVDMEKIAAPWRQAMAKGIALNAEYRPESVRAWWRMCLEGSRKSALEKDDGKVPRTPTALDVDGPRKSAPKKAGSKTPRTPTVLDADGPRAGKKPGGPRLTEMARDLKSARKELNAVKKKLESVAAKPKKEVVHTPPVRDKDCILVSAGRFTMGSPPGGWRTKGELGRADDETQHTVGFERQLWVLRNPITQTNWAAVVGNYQSIPDREDTPHPNEPVVMVSWLDAVHYCNALSKSQGLPEAYLIDGVTGSPGVDLRCKKVKWKGPRHGGWRLPTEAEWEHACRAGTTAATWKGDLSVQLGHDAALEAIAWYNENSASHPHPVNQKQANPWQLHDMLGNVWEWCWDHYGAYPRKGKALLDPRGPGEGSERVYRGGSWRSTPRSVRAAARMKGTPASVGDALGFRIVITCLR